ELLQFGDDVRSAGGRCGRRRCRLLGHRRLRRGVDLRLLLRGLVLLLLLFGLRLLLLLVRHRAGHGAGGARDDRGAGGEPAQARTAHSPDDHVDLPQLSSSSSSSASISASASSTASTMALTTGAGMRSTLSTSAPEAAIFSARSRA